MALILCIETATSVCSVALTSTESVVGYRETKISNSHAEVVTVFIDQLIKDSGYTYTDLSAIAVSKGPGSYTGLRIGVSTAKGLCYALDIPLIGIPTLLTMTIGAKKGHFSHTDQTVLFCPMIDARRMEVYSALFDINYQQVRETKAEIIDKESFAALLVNNKIVFFGDGAAKCREMIDHPNAIFYDDIFPSAQNMAITSFDAFQNKHFEDVAYFEPYYLKDFIPGIPKVKGLI
jgi:tRNA threonylcarbamoyladenosine biosynthesis protein TsaB